MKTQILTGSKSEIAEKFAAIDGVIREVIVLIEESSDSIVEPTVEEMFAEMEPYTVKVGDVDDSRESIYTRMEGE